MLYKDSQLNANSCFMAHKKMVTIVKNLWSRGV